MGTHFMDELFLKLSEDFLRSRRVSIVLVVKHNYIESKFGMIL